MTDIPAWYPKGDWFDVCRCNVPCPCSWAEPPDDDYCEGILVWHIREGRFGDVPLDRLNVVGVSTFKGNVWAGSRSEPRLGVLFDDRADDRQRQALQTIFGGQAGGWPARFVEIFGPEMVGLEFAPITVEVAGDLSSWRAEIPGRVRATANALLGPTSKASRRGRRTYRARRQDQDRSARKARPRRKQSMSSSSSGSTSASRASTSRLTGAVPTHPNQSANARRLYRLIAYVLLLGH